MPDGTYQPKVYRKQGGDELVVASGGKITGESGGELNFSGASAGAVQLPEGEVDTADIAARAVTATKVANAVVAAAEPGIVIQHDIVLTNSTTAGAATVNTTVSHRIEIIDVKALKTGGGASASTVLTVQVQTSTGGAITNAINVKVVDNTIVPAGTIDDSKHIVGSSVGGVIRVVRAGSAGSSLINNSAIVRVLGVKRST